MRTYLRRVPGGCPGYYRPAATACPKRHVVVGDWVYHEEELPSSMWEHVHERREAEAA